MTSVLDEKRRVILPRDIAEELGLSQGSEVLFERGGGGVMIRKARKTKDKLLEAMSWNPRRIRKVRPIKEAQVKEVWR
jgi:AbrB family looped-hinge helix DNA binding protein